MALVSAPPLRGIPKLPPSKVAGAPAAPLYLRNVAQNFWFAPLDSDSTLYVQFNQVADAPDESMAAFATRLGAVLSARPPKTVIIDARHNNGGNLALLTPLVTALHNYELTRRDARIYVLMGRNTFSAAQFFWDAWTARRTRDSPASRAARARISLGRKVRCSFRGAAQSEVFPTSTTRAFQAIRGSGSHRSFATIRPLAIISRTGTRCWTWCCAIPESRGN